MNTQANPTILTRGIDFDLTPDQVFEDDPADQGEGPRNGEAAEDPDRPGDPARHQDEEDGLVHDEQGERMPTNPDRSIRHPTFELPIPEQSIHHNEQPGAVDEGTPGIPDQVQRRRNPDWYRDQGRCRDPAAAKRVVFRCEPSSRHHPKGKFGKPRDEDRSPRPHIQVGVENHETQQLDDDPATDDVPEPVGAESREPPIQQREDEV